MKSAAIGCLSFACLVAVTGAPAAHAAPLDVVFLIDTTGSMSAEISEAKDRVRQIAKALAAQRNNDVVRVGVVAFRDRGDDYLTLHSVLSPDVEKSFKFLSTLDAGGGGDGPEDILSGLQAALTSSGWNEAAGVDRAIFLIGDAPPHLDYTDGPKLETLLALARDHHIAVHAIGCRSLPPEGVEQFRRIAYSTEGTYQHIGRVDVGAAKKSLDQAVLGALDSANGGPMEQLEVKPVERAHDATGARGISVTRTPGTTAGACGIDVALPNGVALKGRPRMQRGKESLVVTLPVTSGSGGTFTYDVSPCGGTTVPLVIEMGGAT